MYAQTLPLIRPSLVVRKDVATVSFVSKSTERSLFIIFFIKNKTVGMNKFSAEPV